MLSISKSNESKILDSITNDVTKTADEKWGVVGPAIVDHKTKKYLLLRLSGWANFADDIIKLRGTLEGTGTGHIEIFKELGQGKYDEIKKKGYKSADNMTLTPKLF